MRNAIIIILLGLLTAVTGCAFKNDVQQGNVITTEKLAKVEPGMDRRQVRFILGSPLLTDPFHADRWDYYYSFLGGNGDVTRYRATVFFDGQRVARVETGGDVPAVYVPPASDLKRE